ncbi:MAG: tripartite tricarboxylate transporter TctB family protein [Hyphomicrobiaceae bacterium]|nr:tripartite tricarboxylate transporter TctB family protein [Hyphomicrobiaceae bacterium]
MKLRRDHVGGAAFILIGALVLWMSDDLPFGTLASPGAGMMPKLVIGAMLALGLVLLARARDSPALGAIAWDDFPHAVRLMAASAACVAVYTWLGFLITMSLLLFGLTFAVERKPIVSAALFSVGVTGFAYGLFRMALKSPLPQGVLWF